MACPETCAAHTGLVMRRCRPAKPAAPVVAPRRSGRNACDPRPVTGRRSAYGGVSPASVARRVVPVGQACGERVAEVVPARGDFEAADACRAAVEADVRRRTERCVVRGVGRRRFGACVLLSVILVCVGASPPSICEEPLSALFYFLSISFPFLLSNAAGLPSHCDRSAAASDAVQGRRRCSLPGR